MKNLNLNTKDNTDVNQSLMRETEREKYRYIDMLDMKRESGC